MTRQLDAQRAPALPTAVAAPLTEVALRGAIDAARAGLIEPVLVAPERQLRELAARCSVELGRFQIVPATDEADAARKAVRLCREGRVRLLMKGSLASDTLMREAVRRETGIRTARRMSHVFVLDVPTYPRPLFITDAALNIAPTLEEKAEIVQNAIDLADILGIRRPKVAILAATETVHARMQATIDAAALSKMAERGQIRGAVVDGPLAFDAAVSRDAAAIKHLTSEVAGAADILVTPDLESGNMLVKQLEYMSGAELAGVVVGGTVPVVLTSRADSARARLASCAIASMVALHRSGAAT